MDENLFSRCFAETNRDDNGVIDMGMLFPVIETKLFSDSPTDT
ncbi:hypothetical protein SAMN05216534_1537 [Candidatus Aquiluna sp. UB-MaderosW2red]|nr:hypothetical protein SAMN05216534_1537 [Candidatus Aquiluna sp. UB-MaderosW2red]